MLSWHPVVTADSIDNTNTYEYGASVVNGRLFCCCGLGTDTLVSVRLDGKGASKPFTIPGKLTADPAAIHTQAGYDLFFTVGNLNGKQNGIGVVRCNPAGVVNSHPVMVLGQSLDPSTYGIGQPSIADIGAGVRIMAARFDRDGGGDQIKLFRMVNYRVQDEIPFTDVEDGASPEIFWLDGKLHMLIAGGGYIGIRTYVWNEYGQLRRERELEQPFTLTDNGHFWAREAVFAGDTIDGVGVVRDAANKPIVNVQSSGRRTVGFWRAAGKAGDPSTWGLKRMYIHLPD